MVICEVHNEEKVWHGKKLKCRSCNREYQRKWFHDNKDTQLRRVKSNSKISRERNREWLFLYLKDHPCIVCGEPDPIVLQFDHLDPKQKSYTIANMLMGYSLETIRREVDKCQVLCANCHSRRTAAQFDWYNYQRMKTTFEHQIACEYLHCIKCGVCLSEWHTIRDLDGGEVCKDCYDRLAPKLDPR